MHVHAPVQPYLASSIYLVQHYRTVGGARTVGPGSPRTGQVIQLDDLYMHAALLVVMRVLVGRLPRLSSKLSPKHVISKILSWGHLLPESTCFVVSRDP